MSTMDWFIILGVGFVWSWACWLVGYGCATSAAVNELQRHGGTWPRRETR